MKRYRYLALAVALGAIALSPAIVQAATPMDLEFQRYRSAQGQNQVGQPSLHLLNFESTQDHEMRNKLTYIN